MPFASVLRSAKLRPMTRSDAAMSETPYRSNEVIAALAAACLGLLACFDLVSTLGVAVFLAGIGELGASPDRDLADVGTLIRGLSALVQLAVAPFAVVFFCMFMFRANKNARALGAGGMQFTPGWTVGWFFVPFAHLWMPFKAASEVWRASDPRADTDDVAWWSARLGLLVPAWWACWIGGTLIGNTSSQLLRHGYEAAAGWMGLIGMPLQALAGVLAATVVLRLRARQGRKHRDRARAAREPAESPADFADSAPVY